MRKRISTAAGGIQHGELRVLKRRTCHIALLLLLLATCDSTYPQQPDSGMQKIQGRILQQVSAGEHPDVIVLFDDSRAISDYHSEKNRSKDIDRQSQALKGYRERIAVLGTALRNDMGRQNAAVIMSYDNVPAAVYRVRDRKALDALSRSPRVKAIHENRSLHAMLAESLPLINQPLALELNAAGSGTSVAIIDSGVDYTQATFGPCTAPGIPAGCRVAYAKDFTDVDDGWRDDHGHGTNVAGIALGVASETNILSLDVFKSDGTARDTDIIAALDWVLQNYSAYNIAAVNLSLGTDQRHTSQCTDSLYAGVFELLRDAGILPVVASGNDGYKDGLAEPACVPGAVSVGAVYDSIQSYRAWSVCTDMTANQSQVACFSNSADYLSLLAPGSPISAAGRTYHGTSMAAPHIAGAVAVLRGVNGYPGESAGQIEEHMIRSGRPITDPGNGYIYPLLDLEAALLDGKPAPPLTIDTFSPVSAGDGSTVTITGTGFVKVLGVEFGGVPAGSFEMETSRKITAVVGEGASGSVTVVTSAGTASKAGFVYLSSLLGIENMPSSHQLHSLYDLLQITVIGRYTDGSTTDLTRIAEFSSTNESVAVVDVRGIVRPVAEGTATIRSMVGNRLASTAVEVDFTTAKVPESEPNDTKDSATPVSDNGDLYLGRLRDRSDVDYYRVVLAKPSAITLLIRPSNPGNISTRIRATLLDADENVLASKHIYEDEDEFINLSLSPQKAGTYYLKIEEVVNGWLFVDGYEFTLQLNEGTTGSSRREKEPNDTSEHANIFSIGPSIYGQLSSTNDRDYFAFNLTRGVFTLHAKSLRYVQSKSNNLSIITATGDVLAAKIIDGNGRDYTTISVRIDTAGTYYAVMSRSERPSNYSYFSEDYELIPQFNSSEDLLRSREAETNDNMALATAATLESRIYGQLSSQEDIDYYAFHVSPGIFSIQARSLIFESGQNRLAITDHTGQVLAAKEIYGGENYVTFTVRIERDGTYYAVVSKKPGYYTDIFFADYELIPQFSDNASLIESRELESNDDRAEAGTFSLGTAVYGQLSSRNDVDHFAYELPRGLFIVNVKPVLATPNGGDNTLSIISNTGEVLARKIIENYLQGYLILSARIEKAGTYYLVMAQGVDPHFDGYFYADYELQTQFSNDQQLISSHELESNGSLEEANPFPHGSTMRGQLHSNNDRDYFAFDLAPGVLTVQVQSGLDGHEENRIVIMDGEGTVLAGRVLNNYPQEFILTVRITDPGRYYAVMQGKYDGMYDDRDYELHSQYSTDPLVVNTREYEPNNDITLANHIPTGSSIFGQLSSGEDLDYFAYHLTPGRFTVQAHAAEPVYDSFFYLSSLALLNSAGTVVSDVMFHGLFNESTFLSEDITIPGTYYVVVKDFYNRYFDEDFELISTLEADTDGDGELDSIDPDDDNDSVPDEQDAFPLDPAETLDADHDGSGNNADTDDDDDGMPDAFERSYGFDPLNGADANLDADGDGLNNLDEFQRGTAPDLTDTDQDGATDGEEVILGRNPRVNEPSVLQLLNNLMDE